MKDAQKLLATNRKAHFNFFIEDTLEAGIVLTGAEAKSAKMGHVNLTGAYAMLRNNEAWLIGCHIAPYPYDSLSGSADPTRTRKLLLKRHEINKLATKLRAKGLSLIPLEIYAKNSRVKVLLGLGKGKKAQDKREDIKRRDIEREMAGKHKLR